MNKTRRISREKIYYDIRDGAIYKKDGEFFFNRPLYMQNMPGVAVAGDRPAYKCIYGGNFLGKCFFGISENDGNDEPCWLHNEISQETYFYPNRVIWKLNRLGMNIMIDIMPKAQKKGAAIKISADKPCTLTVAHCCMNNAETSYKGNPMWWNDPIVNNDNLFNTVIDGEASNNLVDPARASISDETGENIVFLKASKPAVYSTGRIEKADALFVTFNIDGGEKLFLSVAYLDDDNSDPCNDYKNAAERYNLTKNRTTSDTPDSFFDIGLGFSTSALEGSYYPSAYVHGAMAWNAPYLGWHNICGSAAYGYIENIIEMAKYFTEAQLKESPCEKPAAREDCKLAVQDINSVFHGKGKIRRGDGDMYNMQSLFFDQLIIAWHYSGNKEIRDILINTLPLHIEWQDNCFERGGSGLYENYINTWPTDTVWHSGGKCPEETAFAYRANAAMGELLKEKDMEKSEQYTKKAKKIKTAFMRELWIKEKGHPAFYVDTTGKQRAHEDAWLWSVMLPIDAGLLDEFELTQALYYTEYALEHIQTESGERVYLSNFIPYMWSTRTLNEAEDFSLALCYFKAGLFEDGYKYFRSAFIESQYNQCCPGTFGNRMTSCDFTDISSVYCRTVIEGLFGYRARLDKNKLELAPSVPFEWDKMEINATDFNYKYAETGDGLIEFKASLQKHCDVSVKLPLKGRRPVSALLNGKDIAFVVEPGFGQTFIIANIPNTDNIDLMVRCSGEKSIIEEAGITVDAGKTVSIECEYAISEIKDPCGAFIIDGMNITPKRAGNFLLFAKLEKYGLPVYKLIKVDAAEKNETVDFDFIPQNAIWRTIDISKYFNGDIAAIFKQEYLSPRADTCSAYQGTDGYIGWTGAYWNITPPPMSLSWVEYYYGQDSGSISLPQGVAFDNFIRTKGKNIAFTSLYDNYPGEITIPLNDRGRVLWFLVAGSTNAMQTNIENAEIIVLYEDGDSSLLPLVPPKNYRSVHPQARGGDGFYEHINHQWPVENNNKYKSETVHLGEFCDANLLNITLKDKKILSVTLRCLSNEVVVGIMGMTLMK